MEKISHLTNELCDVWLEWMRLNKISTNSEDSPNSRVKAARQQEALINERYKIIEKINNFFDEKTNQD